MRADGSGGEGVGSERSVEPTARASVDGAPVEANARAAQGSAGAPRVPRQERGRRRVDDLLDAATR